MLSGQLLYSGNYILHEQFQLILFTIEYKNPNSGELKKKKFSNCTHFKIENPLTQTTIPLEDLLLCDIGARYKCK